MLRLLASVALSYFTAASLQTGEELVDVLPDFGSSGEAAPMQADETDEMKTFVDGYDVVLGRRADAIDEEGFDIGFHRLERGMLGRDLGPGFQAEQRFNGAGGAGVHGHHPAFRGVVVEEGQVDGDHERFPLQIRHLEVGESPYATGNAEVVGSGLAAEEHGATVAGAGNLTLAMVQQMLVCRCYLDAAELAVFGVVGEGTTTGGLSQK